MSNVKLAKRFGLYLTVVLSVAGAVRADWTYSYSDDFSGSRAQSESYRHSAFWTMDAAPLPEPYLSSLEVNENPGLAFVEYRGRLAELGYRFPVGSGSAQRFVKGVVAVDVSFPQSPPGRLLCSVSPDGVGWSAAEPLEEGHQEIPVFSPNGVCYILFTGTRAMIDNLAVALQSAPVTMTVPRDYPTIQAAIDAAGDGDVIEVAPATYTGPGNRDIDFRGKAITVRSLAGPQTTIIDCGGSAAAAEGGHRGFYFHGVEGPDSVVSGFTIRGGRAFGSEVPPDPLHWTPGRSHPLGGGIYCEFSSPTISNCIIRDCGAEVGGGLGGVGADPTIVDCTIEACIAGGFGAAQSGGRGAALGFVGFSNATISNCIIRDNLGYSNSRGAGLYFWQSNALVAGCTILANKAPGSLQGGGAYCGGTSTAVTFQNCIFSRNQAEAGAGLFTEGTSGYDQCRVQVINCTFARNQVTGPLSAAVIQSAGTDILINSSILWANTGKALAITSSLSREPVTYCDVQGGYLGMGNLNTDPLFAAADREDYHLKSKYGRYDPQGARWTADSVHSPCIDAGDPDASVADEPAPNGKRVNMGAYGGTRQASNGTQHSIWHVALDGRPQAFRTIQAAIDTAGDGDTVLVWPGVYRERLVFKGKAITVQSAADAAVLTPPPAPNNAYGVCFYDAEGPGSVLSNLVITGFSYSAVFCVDSASPTLKNLTVVGNGFGIEADAPGDPNIINCILWDNSRGDLFECTARYSNIQHGDPDKRVGNMNADPLFADPDRGDYHLKSRTGRYVPQWDTWVTDSEQSPCIDAGDPWEDPRGERMPNGDRINLGAYGGTPFASLSD